MRGFGIFWVFLALAVAAHAAPVPPPPEGFAGMQYVDGRGCVWRRPPDGDWSAWRDGAGGAICGFPPTLEARRTDPDAERVLAPEHPPRPPSVEDLLADRLASGLRQGDLVADPRPAEIRRAPQEPETPPQEARDLTMMARQEAALRSALNKGADGRSDLCGLLGYRPDLTAVPILGGDVTLGLCPGMRAEIPTDRIVEGGRAPDPAPVPALAARAAARPKPSVAPGGAVSAVTADRRAPARPDRASTGPALQAGGSVTARHRPPKPTPSAPPQTEMIPASARYVQVGGYGDDENAVATIRRLSAMGYRVAQTRTRSDDRTIRLVMAGPFTDRRSLIAALNRLRSDGYPRAVAR